MRLSLAEARALVERAMRTVGHDDKDARLIADHLLDCELRGIGYGGLSRAVSIVERIRRTGDRRRPIRTVRETPVSALFDGGDHIGYVVAHRATTLAIAKAKASGLAMVGANDTWYTGMLSYFAEMATAEGFVAMIASNASPWVAPHGATEGRFGTNPICFGFPSTGDPIIWDIGTSAIMHAEVMLAQRLGRPLPESVAFDAEGRSTREPVAALAGAFAAWGGHKGSGLGLVVQMLGMMAGSPGLPPDLAGFGYLMVLMDPGLLTAPESFKAEVAKYADAVRGSRPVAGGGPVRMPFDRSAAERRRRLADGFIDVPDAVCERLAAIEAG
jgi:LDH2 family malate/lactate/ureidoglycolate dehydrogenase